MEMSKAVKNFLTVARRVIFTLFAATVSAINLHVLIVPAEFAPAGVNGIATMLQRLTGVGIGWYTLLINLPLLITAWFILKRKYVIYTILYTAFSSAILVVLERIEFYQLILPDEKLLVALFSGALLGFQTGVMLKIGASTGGVDIVAGCIAKKKPHINVEIIISVISFIIVGSSIFVYKNALSVMLSIVQIIISKIVVEIVMKDTRNAVEFKIVTKNPEMLSQKIIKELRHGATVIESKGMFSGDSNYIITTVVNIRQIPELLSIVKCDEQAFVTYSEIMGVNGNFKWNINRDSF